MLSTWNGIAGDLAGCDCVCCCRLDCRDDLSLWAYGMFSFGAEVALSFRSVHGFDYCQLLGGYSLLDQMLGQVIWTMVCLFAPFVSARVLLFRIMAELMSSAVFSSGKDLCHGGKRDDSLAILEWYLPSNIQGAGTHGLACPS